MQPGVSRLITTADANYSRYSEADVIALTDSHLFLAVARKVSSSDFSPGTLIGMFSTDGGRTWDDEPHVVQAPWGDIQDLMSVSLLRTPHGLHLFFLARGPDAKSDTRVYQMLSTDDAKTWQAPVRVSARPGYHIVNNARVIQTHTGRILIPCAYSESDVTRLKEMTIHCLFSDDQGVTWKESNELRIESERLMEPGVAQCADGSIYMTIRTALGHLYEARSTDDGATWADMKATTLPSPAAPSTVFRDPASDNLWLIWCNSEGTKWKQRSRQVLAISKDHGKTWDAPRIIEDDPTHGYGYFSIDVIRNHVLLTYYDWEDKGQRDFAITNLRQRLIPIDYFHDRPTPPGFASLRDPVLRADKPWEQRVASMNSGVLAEGDHFRLWYTTGSSGPAGEQLRVCFAESVNQGLTWIKPTARNDTNIVLPSTADDNAKYYHSSIHREGEKIVAHIWRSRGKGDFGLHRFTSSDNGKTFQLEPERPIICGLSDSAEHKQQAGDGRISNDAFDMLRNADGSYEYFAAKLVKATDPRTIIKHDNVPGMLRYIAHATSPEGIRFSPTEIIIKPDYEHGDPYDEQFYGMQVFRHRKFYLGLLHTYYVESQIIQPEWAWSHDGISWTRTRTPCISLGDEGAFDSRMILFGHIVLTDQEVIWLYSGYDWRHNQFKKETISSAIGRATIPRADFDQWVDSLPQP